MVVFFGSIFALQAAGVYDLLPEKLATGEYISFEEIKGYMTIQEAAAATNTEIEEFYKKFAIPENVPASTMMKGIGDLVEGYDFDGAKEALGSDGDKSEADADKADSTDASADSESDAAKATATDVTTAPVSADPATAAAGKTAETPASAASGEPAADKPAINADAVKGKMTIKDAAAAAGVDMKEFYKLFAIPENVPSNTYMRDIANTVAGYDFEARKDALK